MLSDSHFRSVIDSSKSKIVFHVIIFHPFSYLLLVCIFSIATHSIFICGFKIYVLVHKKEGVSSRTKSKLYQSYFSF